MPKKCEKVELTCQYCGKPFKVVPSVAKGGAKYCSNECRGLAQRKRVKRLCLQCGKEFEVNECYVRRGQGKFCSTACGTIYKNLHNNPAKSPEVRKKIADNHADVSGKNNPAYTNGHKIYRKTLIQEAGFPICFCCGSNDQVDVHHIDGNRDHNEPDNLVFLCKKCHMGKAHKGKKLNLEFKEWLQSAKTTHRFRSGTRR